MPGTRPQIGDIIEVRTVCQNSQVDQIAMNVFHYRMQSQGSTSPLLSEVCNNFHTAMAPGYQLLMSNNCVFRGVGVKNLTPPATVEYVSTLPDNFGLVASDEEPQQVSYIVNFKTEFSGRGYRGRCYPGFVPKSHVNTSGNMSATGITALQLFTSGLPLTLNAGGSSETALYELVILRRVANKVPLPFGTYAKVVLKTARFQFATQRRRGDFGRTNSVPLGF